MTRERFIDLVRAEQEPVRRFLLGLCCGDDALADDIAQDALVRAYVASGTFLGLSKFSTWLFRIGYNCYIDHCRKPGKEHASVESPEVLAIPADTVSDASFRYQQLYQALERLPEKERTAIVLHYFEDLPVKDIAVIMQIPAGTVKYHLSVGRDHLKQHIRL
jgi:RNA polymerase sigma-70 factor (ECF subfamily)